MNASAIRAIESYIRDLGEPQMHWKKSRRDQRIYSRWAANELLGYVIFHKEISPLQAVEDFMRKMDSFACLNQKNSFIFSVAYDTAADILDLLIYSLRKEK